MKFKLEGVTILFHRPLLHIEHYFKDGSLESAIPKLVFQGYFFLLRKVPPSCPYKNN